MRNVFDQPALTRPFGPPSPGGRGTCSAAGSHNEDANWTHISHASRVKGTKSKIHDVKLNPLEQNIREMSKLQAPRRGARTFRTALPRRRGKQTHVSNAGPDADRRVKFETYRRFEGSRDDQENQRYQKFGLVAHHLL